MVACMNAPAFAVGAPRQGSQDQAGGAEGIPDMDRTSLRPLGAATSGQLYRPGRGRRGHAGRRTAAGAEAGQLRETAWLTATDLQLTWLFRAR